MNDSVKQEIIENEESINYHQKWHKQFFIKIIASILMLIGIAIICIINPTLFKAIPLYLFIILFVLSIISITLCLLFWHFFKIEEDEYLYLFKGVKLGEKHQFKENANKNRIINTINDYITIVSTSLFIVLFVFSFIAFFADVTQTSMRETLNPGDKVLALKHTQINNGDIIIFEYSNSYQKQNDSLDKTLLVKRVIASSGDSFRVDNGIVYVNDVRLNEEYVKFNNVHSFSLINVINNNALEIREELLAYISENNVIPKGYYLVLGDNRASSNDSEEFGLVHESQITGEVKLYKTSEGWKKNN